MDPLIQELTKEQLRDDMPEFRAGDTVRVHVRVVEGTHERIQLFEGVVIKKKGTGNPDSARQVMADEAA